MLFYLKNSFYCLLLICFTTTCKQDSDIEVGRVALSKPTNLIATTSFTLLQYGELPPPIYFNGVDLIGKKYKIKFIDVAGCVVDDKLVDSVNQYNAKTYVALKQLYKRDLKQEIEEGISSEYAYLTKLDSTLRSDKHISNQKDLKDQLIYYTKKNKNYLAHFIVSEPHQKGLNFKLKLIVTLDSATKIISSISAKDSIIEQFSDLQL